MTKWLEEIKGTNTPLETNGVFEVEKEDTKKWVEDTLKIWKIIISEEEIESILKENRVTQRIILLRHYPYNEETEDNRETIREYNDLLSNKFKWETVDNERLSDLEKIVDSLSYKTYDELKDERIKKIIKALFFKKDKLLFFYSNIWKQRVKNTWEDLIKVFSLNNIDYINLKGSDKSLPLWHIYIDMSSKFKYEYVKIKNNEENKKYETIIIIWNRTYSYGMNFISWDWNITIRESEKDFEREGYIIHDYNSKWEIITKNEKNIWVSPENYLELIKIFNIEHNGIVDFQNKLSIYFIKNPELIKIYVKSEIEELRKYCLFKLIETKELETLNEIFWDDKYRKEIKLEDYEKWDIRVYNILRYYTEVYPKVLEIRSKSLDLRIKKWEYISPNFNFDREEYNEILELIKTGKPIKYIEWKAWAGKSFLLSHIAEKLNEENLNNNNLKKIYYPVYINLSGKSIDAIEEIDDEIYSNYQVLYLIDSIDESNIKTKEEIEKLDKKLLELSKKWKVIITSRNWYQEKYDEEKEDEKYLQEQLNVHQEKLQIQDFTSEQIGDYLLKYFWEKSEKIKITKNILLKLSWAWDNPLLLCMICEIVENWTIDWINLDYITIINIYEWIVNLRLLDWNNKAHNRKIDNKKYLQNILEWLNKIAYEQLISWKSITKEIIKDYIIISSDEALEWLNLLFRKNEDWEYDFVHQSFKEYFAAKYIFEEMKKNQGFDYEDFLCQKLKKVDLNFLEILVDFIKTDEKIKTRFLESIDENENYFPKNIHYKIIYILWLMDIKLMNKYYNTLKYSLINYSIKWSINDNSNIQQVYDSIFIDNIEISIVSISILNKKGLLDKFLNDILHSKLNDSIIAFVLDLLYEESFFKYKEIILKFLNSDSEIILSKIIEILWNVWWYENNLILISFLDNKSNLLKNKSIESLWKIWWKENELIIKSYINDISFLSWTLKWLLYIWWDENINFIISLINDKKINYHLLWEVIWFSEKLDDFILEEIDKWNIGFSNWMIEKFLLLVGGEKNRNFFLEQVKKNNSILKYIISILEDKDSIASELINFLKIIIEYWDDEEKLKIISIIWESWTIDDINFFKKYEKSNNSLIKEEISEILLYHSLLDNENVLRYNIINSNDQYLLLKSIELLWEIWWKNNIKLLLNKLKNTKDINVIYEIIKTLEKIWWEKNKKIVWKYKKKYKKYFS